MIFELLYSDPDIAVIKKPAGILSEGQINDEKSAPGLISTALCEQGRKVSEIFTVHRLDRETRGLMVYALTQSAAAKLSGDIAAHRLKKIYTATVHGRPEQEQGELRDLLFFDRKRGKSFAVERERKGVKEAILNYSLLSFDEKTNTSKIEIELKTGRTHQIRVQFASRKMPLFGDRKYGAPKDDGNALALASVYLAFSHPKTKEQITIPAAKYPAFSASKSLKESVNK